MSQRHFPAPPAIPIDAAALDLGDLSDQRARRAGGAGDDDGLARDRTADVEKAEIGGHADHAEDAHREFDRSAGGQLVQADRLCHDIVLPAHEAEHDIADLEGGTVRRFDPARAERAHDLADLDRRQIGVAGDPGALGRVAGQDQIADDHLAFAGRGRLRLDEGKVAILERPVRTLGEQPLAVFHFGRSGAIGRSS